MTHIQSHIDSWLSITDSQFINNTARNGGAVMLYDSRQKINHTNPSVITKCRFINNVARNANGGAI